MCLTHLERALGAGDDEQAETGPSLAEVERQLIADRLRTLGWHQQLTADSLGIDRKTLYRKIRRYGLRQDA